MGNTTQKTEREIIEAIGFEKKSAGKVSRAEYMYTDARRVEKFNRMFPNGERRFRVITK